MLAHYSNDHAFMDLVHKGYDVHQGTAAVMFNKPYEDITPAERDQGKTGNFATVYGIGNPAMAKSFGHKIDEKRLRNGSSLLYKTFQAWKLPPYAPTFTYQDAVNGVAAILDCMTPEEKETALDGIEYFFSEEVQNGLKFASDFKKKYFGVFKDIKQFTKDCSAVAASRGYIKYWTGRRRHFKDPKNEAYKAPNSLIQGGCGDVIKKKMAEVRYFLKDGGYKTKMVNNVHDELTTMHPIEERELLIIPEINKILCDLPFRVPISWGIDWGYKWGEKREFVSMEQLFNDVGLLDFKWEDIAAMK